MTSSSCVLHVPIREKQEKIDTKNFSKSARLGKIVIFKQNSKVVFNYFSSCLFKMTSVNQKRKSKNELRVSMHSLIFVIVVLVAL